MSDQPVIKAWTPQDAAPASEEAGRTSDSNESNEPVLPARRTKKDGGGKDRTTVTLLAVAVLVAVAGIAFAGGRMTASTSGSGGGDDAVNRNGANGIPNGNGEYGFPGGGRELPSLAPGQTLDPGQFVPGNGGGGQQLGVGNGSTITGTVESFDGTTLTVKLANGSTVRVNVTGSTTYSAEVQASPSALTAGVSVIVQIDTSATAVPGASASGAGATGQSIQARSVIIQSR